MEFEKIRNIYNTMTLIETKGESTILMGACLSTLKEVLQSMAQAQTAPVKKDE